MSEIAKTFSLLRVELLAQNAIMFTHVVEGFSSSVKDSYRSMPPHITVDGKKLTTNKAKNLAANIATSMTDNGKGLADGKVYLRPSDVAMEKDGRIFETYSPLAPFKLARSNMRNKEFIEKICMKTYPDIKVRIE